MTNLVPILAFTLLSQPAAPNVEAPMPKPPEARATPMSRTATGAIVIDSALVTLIHQVAVPSREAGTLVRVQVREGVYVKAGDLLAVVDDADARLAEERVAHELAIARRTAESDVDIQLAKKAEEQAAAHLRRATASVEAVPGTLTPGELDDLRFAVARARLSITKAQYERDLAGDQKALRETELAIARRAVQRREIVAPRAGIVVQVKHKEGEWVQPGETVIRLVEVDKLRVEGYVPASQIEGDWTGRRATFHCLNPAVQTEEFSGEITFVDPESDPVTGQTRVWAEFDNSRRRLRPGWLGTLTIAPNGEKPGVTPKEEAAEGETEETTPE